MAISAADTPGMRGAAPRQRRRFALRVCSVLVVAVAATLATGAVASARAATSVPELWGVAAKPSFTAKTFKRLRRAGINTVILDHRSLRPRQLARLSRRARSAHLRVLQPLALTQRTTAPTARKACDNFRQAHPGSPCSLFAPSYGAGLTLAQAGVADLVVVRLGGPGALRVVQGPRSGRMVALLSLRGPFKARAWRTAIRAASRSSTLDLAIAPANSHQRTFSGYLGTLSTSKVTSVDRKAPSTPTGLTVVDQTQVQLGARWRASTDQRGVAGYDLYLDGRLVATPTTTSGTASNLACGTSHKLAVDAFDLAGNRSGKATITGSTSPCILSPSDILPPSQPSGLTVASRGVSTVALSWGSSVDNFEVAGYRVYRNNVLVGSTQATSFTVTGLDCGTLYDLAVDAYDYAGNSSAKSSLASQTLACAAPTGLVAAFSFNDGTGTTAGDSSGKGNAGVTSGTSWSSLGHNSGALSFNGSNSWVTVADTPSLDLSGGMTLEAWVYPTALGAWRTALIKEDTSGATSGQPYALYASGNTSAPLGMAYGGAEARAYGSSQLPLSTWTHLATTYDGSTVRLYVNGSLAGTQSLSGPMPASPDPLRIGGNASWGEYFAGRIDDVRVYNRALTGGEVATDMATPVPTASGTPPPPPPPPPLRRLRLLPRRLLRPRLLRPRRLLLRRHRLRVRRNIPTSSPTRLFAPLGR